MTADTFKNYLLDLVTRLREEADEARSLSRSGDAFQSGRAMAYAEVLSMMQGQADAFLISLRDLNLDGFDPIATLGSPADKGT